MNITNSVRRIEKGYSPIKKLDKCLKSVNPLILRDHISFKREIFGDKRSKQTKPKTFIKYFCQIAWKKVSGVNFESEKWIKLFAIKTYNKYIDCY